MPFMEGLYISIKYYIIFIKLRFIINGRYAVTHNILIVLLHCNEQKGLIQLNYICSLRFFTHVPDGNIFDVLYFCSDILFKSFEMEFKGLKVVQREKK